MIFHRQVFRVLASAMMVGVALRPVLFAQAPSDDSQRLPSFVTTSSQVANQTPGATIAMPVSGLRYEPRVDVQARNQAENQADVTIRGGIFENTGFKIGAVALFDPQTGHYFAEIPVPPAMLAAPVLRLSSDNAATGFNANVGTVDFSWRPIEPRGEISVAAGQFGFNRQSLYQGLLLPTTLAGRTLAVDAEWARSESDGSLPFGDHNFQRVGGRIQLRDANSQTDAFAGYQHKFFGWPNLYTPFGSKETENLKTALFAVNHREWDNAGNFWQVGAYYRRNDDDYAFNRFAPVPAVHPFQHTSYTRGVAFDGRQQFTN